MGSAVPIVELLNDVKYKLNEEVLTTIVSKAFNCQKCAVISTFGSKQNFLLNFLISYLESHNKTDWLTNNKSINNCKFKSLDHERPSVTMWSEPFVLEAEDQNIAIFLMNSSHIFSSQTDDKHRKLMEDIISLFCFTSSTLVFTEVNGYSQTDMEFFASSFEKVLFDNNNKKFQEVLHLVFEWDPKQKHFPFGFNGGNSYLEKEFKIDLNQYFNKNRCYLLPSTGVNTDDQFFNQKEFEKQFIFEFRKLIKHELLNIDEMQTKTSNDNGHNLKPEQLLPLFRQTVQQLNESQTQTENQFIKEDQRKRTLNKISIESEEVVGCLEQNAVSSEYIYQQLLQSSDEFDERDNRCVSSDDSFEIVRSSATFGINVINNINQLSNGTASDDNNKSLISEEPLESDQTINNETIDIPEANNSNGKQNDEYTRSQNDPEIDELSRKVEQLYLDTGKTGLSPGNQIDFQNQSDECQTNHYKSFKPKQLDSVLKTNEGKANLDSSKTIKLNGNQTEDCLSRPQTETNQEIDFTDLIQKLKEFHSADLMSFLETKKIMNNSELMNQHMINKIQLKEKLVLKLQNQSQEIKNQMIDKFESDMKYSYDLVVEESDRRKQVAFTENLNFLILEFCDKVRNVLDHKLIHKMILEKNFIDFERHVKESLEINVGKYDALLYTNILTKLSANLATCEEGFRAQRINNWIKSMEEFNNKLNEIYFEPTEKNSLEKKFKSNDEFKQFINKRSEDILKQFDLKYNINDDFGEDYNRKRQELSTKLDQMNEILLEDYTLRQEFEKRFEQIVIEYDKSMMALIETKIETQMSDILSLKISGTEFTGFHIKSKDKIYEKFENDFQVIEKKSYKFPESFEKKLLNVLDQKKSNFDEIIKSIKNYLEDWERGLIGKPYIENIDNYNKIIVQRRSKLLDHLNNDIKDNALKLFDQIFPGVKTENEKKQQVFRERYEKLLKDSVDLYEQNMLNSIDIRMIMFNNDMDLSAIHKQRGDKTHEYFRDESKKFDTINDKNSTEFKIKLSKILNTKKEKYQSALGQINHYRIEWINKMNQGRIFSEEKLNEMNEEMFKSFQKSNDEKLDSILFKQMNKIFEEIQAKNVEIKNQEEKVASQVFDTTVHLFQQTFDIRLKSGLYKGFEVELMFNRLLEYTKNCFNKRLDFNEYQNKLKDHYLDQLDTKLKTYSKEAFSLHSRKSVYATNIIKQSIDSSVVVYKDWINGLISSGRKLKPSEFQFESKSMRDQIFNNILCDWKSFRDYFIESFYKKLLSDTRHEIYQKFNEIDNNFIKNNLSKELSIAVYFGRKSLYSAHNEQDFTNFDETDTFNISPNCIAIDNKVMVGSEAFHYYSNSDKEHFKDFDIKALIGKTLNDKRDILTPFKVNYENRVKVSKNGKLHEFTVEALMALQVLEIKSKYKDQLNAIVERAVFTVPTHFDIRQKNCMKDVAKIAGIESIEILTEITAAAISYANDIKMSGKSIIKDVLLIAINDEKCDAAICEINYNQIKYKSHFQYELKDNDINCIRSSRNTNGYYDMTKNCFKNIFKKIFDKKQFQVSSIENIVIIGSSDLIPDLKYYIKTSEKFDKTGVDKIIYKCHPLEIIAIGTALHNRRKSVDITEVSLYQINYQIESSHQNLTGTTEFIKQNKMLPKFITNNLGLIPQYNDFPFSVVIYQNTKIVDLYRIMPSDKDIFEANYKVIKYFNHEVIVGSEDNGDLYVKSRMFSVDNKTSIDLVIQHLTFGLTSQNIQEQKNNIRQLVLNVHNNVPRAICENPMPKDELKSIQNQNSIDPEIDSSRLELIAYYENIKNRTESNTSLKPFIRENIEQQLAETLAVIESEESNKQKFIAHKGFLEKFERFLK